MQIVELKVNVEKSQLEALAAEVNKLNGKVINFKTSTTGAGAATAGMQKGFNQTAAAADKAGQSILGVVGKVAKWTAVTTAVYAPIKAFKEAVTTIKALDTEMVNVQKVTGASARQMQQFQDRAYQLSTQYGRSVTDVAAAMTSFARAGYGDKLDEMAELSTLVQNVGYVSEDTADSMLLAVDAAWKLNGSHTELMKVIDGVDKVTNQNATDFQKMAEGMTVAASVFAESGESIQTFAAMVGTGTAATQRGGSEIARGLRTIMMNIRQIKGETEDGELIDGESIAKASAALKEFAGISTMENGELRKASDVLADLAHKWDELDTVQQSAISEALAGKRQANILTALMGNWDMVEKQMREYADAAGTAFKENDIYMDSWAAKTEQLKAKWTDFVSNFVTSDLATGFLDGLIKGVEVLDSGFGQAAISAAALGLALSGIMKVFAAIKGAQIFKDIALFGTAFSEVFASQGIIAALGQTLALLGPIGIAIASIVAAVGTMKLADFLTVDYSEQVEKVKNLKNEYDELYGTQSEYQQLVDKQDSGKGLDDWEQRRLDYLKEHQKELKNQIELEKELAKEKYQQEYGNQRHVNEPLEDRPTGKRRDQKVDTQDVAMARDLAKAFKELNSEFESGAKGESEYKASIKDLMDQYEDFVSLTREGLDEGWLDYGDLTDAQKQILDLYDALERLYSMDGKELRIEAALDSFEQAGDGVTQFANQVVVDGAKMRQAFMDAGLSAEDANRTIQELRDGGAIVIDVENDGIDQTLGYLEELGVAKQDVEGNWNIDFGDVQNLAKELGMSADEATTLAAELSKLNGVNVTGAVESTDRIATSVKELMNGAPYTFDMNAIDNASGTVEGVKTEIESTPETHDTSFNGEASGVTGAASSAEGAITSVDKTWNTRFTGSPQDVVNKSGTAKSAVGTVPRSWSTTFSGNTGPIAAAVSRAKALIASLGSGVGPGGGKAGSGNAGLHKATGDLHFRGGPVLLGDELSPDGSPRPELVITKNGAFIAGIAGPVMTSLPAGSRILKYSDTLDVLSGSDMTRLQAFPGGTGTGGLSLSEIRARGQSSGVSSGSASSSASKPSTSTSSGSSSRSSGSSGSRSSGSSRSSGRYGGRSSGSSGSSGGGGSNVDTLKEELELLEAQYSFLEASNASTEELSDKSKEIQGKLHQINDTLRSTGGKEKDIVDYSTKWWQEQEKIRETTQKVFEDRRELLETELEIMDASGKALDNRTAEREEIEKALRAYQQGGNVNLLKRPVIDASILRDVGWDDAGDGQATVFSSTFSNEDGTLAINFTPIIADKDGNFIDALEPDALWEYAEEVIEGVHDDYLNLQIGAAFTGEDAIEQAEKAAEEIHNLHEKYFLEDIGKEKTLYEAQIESIEAVQDSLHQEAEYLRSIGADQKDINKLSAQWWQELKKIREVQRKVYQDERDLLQSEADLMEHQNKSASERIAKLRQIQDSLHQEAEYMRSIKASQAEINQLSIQWWEIEKSILAIQRDLVDQLNAAMTAAIDNAEDKVEDSTKVHRDNIKQFEKEREDALESLKVKYKELAQAQGVTFDIDRDDLEVERAKADLEQKRLDIEKARIALENAQKDRTVRYYNAATGQWEWGADAQKVKQAQEAYDKSQESLDEAEANLKKEEFNLAYEREAKAIEKQYDDLIQAEEDTIDAMSDTLDSLRDRWDEMYQRMFGSSTENIEKILQQMLEQGLITEEQAAEIRAFWDKINGFAASIDDTTKKILAVVKTFADARAENPNLTFAQYLEGLEEEGVVIDTSRFSPSLVDYIENNPNSGWQAIGENGVGIDSEGNIFVAPSDVHARRSGMYYSEDESGNGVYVSSGDVARSHFHTGDDGTQEQLEERRRQQSQEQTSKVHGSSSASSSSSTSSSSSGSSSRSSEDKINGLVDSGFMTADSPLAKALRENGGQLGTHDSGGILNGFGGIKATARDEIVIPPDLAEYMLKPSANKTFQSRVSELAYLYGAKPIPGTLSNNRSSNDHYGDTYTFGNVTLTEDKAKNTTVYELAQMSRSLGIYRNG